MNEDEDDEKEESPVRPVLPWISGVEAFKRFGKTAQILKELVKFKKLRIKNINGSTMYSLEDLESLPGGNDTSQPETSMADLVRAAGDLLAKGQKHHELMFDKLTAREDKIFDTLVSSIDKQNAHILELEKQAMEMREATDKVFNLEHVRKMDELREERTRSMQAKAIEMLQKTVAPWIAAKVGGMPGAAGAEGSDPRLAQLGQAVVEMAVNMNDEQFTMLGNVIPAEYHAVLASIRDSMKGAQA